MKIGILTSGGDAPGLNAVIRGIILKGATSYKDMEFVGIRDGWRGLVEGDFQPLTRHDVRGLSQTGGTILGSSRTHPYDHPQGGAENIKATLAAHGVDAVIAIGGEGTLAGADRMYKDGINIVGVPKTIDNDLRATDYSFGFDTAVNIATEAMDRLRTTGESHQRCMIAEVMGRHVGWIALHSGIAAGAHAIAIPEVEMTLDDLCGYIEHAHNRGRAPLLVVAEGFKLKGMEEEYSRKGVDALGRPRLGGIGEMLAPLIEEKTGIETRATVLGHIQRGGAPSAFDRVLATRLGMHAADLVHEQAYGEMPALRGTDIVRVKLEEALGELNYVPQYRYDEAASLFG